MKVKYRSSDGEIIAMGSHIGTLGPDESEATVNVGIPQKIRHWKYVNGKIIEKTREEKETSDAKIRKIKRTDYTGLTLVQQKKVSEELIARLATTMLTESELQDIINS